MKKMVALVLLIILIFLGKKGYSLFQKYRHSDQLKISVDSFKLPNLTLSNLLGDITAQVLLSIDNFSPSTFRIDQLNIEVYSEKGVLLAEQKTPLSKSIHLKPKQKNSLPLSFIMSSHNIKELIQQYGGISNIGANYFSTGKYGLPLIIKGFVVAEGFNIDINESYTV